VAGSRTAGQALARGWSYGPKISPGAGNLPPRPLDAGHTALTLGTTPISIPEPLAGHLHDLTQQRHHLSQVPAGGPGPWLFPGLHPGQPVLPATISHRLARIGVDTVTGRASALLQLAGELPPTVVADLLGLRPKTAIAWGQLAGRPWAAYPGQQETRTA
jgi:hypothetical protein